MTEEKIRLALFKKGKSRGNILMKIYGEKTSNIHI